MLCRLPTLNPRVLAVLPARGAAARAVRVPGAPGAQARRIKPAQREGGGRRSAAAAAAARRPGGDDPIDLSDIFNQPEVQELLQHHTKSLMLKQMSAQM